MEQKTNRTIILFYRGFIIKLKILIFFIHKENKDFLAIMYIHV